MERQDPIYMRQFQILVILFTIGTTVLITPAGLAEVLKQDAWIAPIIAMGPGLLLALLYSAIIKAFPGKNLIQICKAILGKWLGKMVSFLFVGFTFLAAAMSLHDVGRFLTTVIMPETPISFVNMLFVFLLTYAIGSGFDTLARMMELFFPWVVLLFLFLVIFILPQIDLKNAQPLLMELEINKLTYATLIILSTSYMPLIAFLMIPVKGQQLQEQAKKAFIRAVLLGGITSGIIVALTILVIGANVTALQEFPVYHLAQKISVGNFLERVEAIVAGIWLITIFAKISVYYYSAVSGIAGIINVKSIRSVLLPMSLLLLIVSLDIFPNSVFENEFNATDWIALVLIIGVFFPLCLLLTHYIVQLFRKQQEGSDEGEDEWTEQ